MVAIEYSHAIELQGCQSSMGREKAGYQRTPLGTIRESTNRGQRFFIQNREVHCLMPLHLPAQGNFAVTSTIPVKIINNYFILDYEICLNTRAECDRIAIAELRFA